MAKAADISNRNPRQLDKNRRPVEPSEGETERKKNLARQPTTDPQNTDESKTPGSGMMPDGGDEASSG